MAYRNPLHVSVASLCYLRSLLMDLELQTFDFRYLILGTYLDVDILSDEEILLEEIKENSKASAALNVTYDSTSLLFDSQRKLVISEAIHYPRSTPEHLVEIVTVGDVIAFLASGVLIAANISFIDSISLFTLINIVFPISLSSDSY
ncbi:hypothetical protein AgCh_018104 [Apium graveolens]